MNIQKTIAFLLAATLVIASIGFGIHRLNKALNTMTTMYQQADTISATAFNNK